MSTAQVQQTPPEQPPAGPDGAPTRQGTYADVGEKLPMSIKLAYGMPNFAGGGMAIPIAVHMPQFYADAVLLPLGYVALAIALARSFDALTDPLMGWVSDRTNTRFGRRIPWMLAGAPLCAVAFVMLFSPPVGMSTTSAAVWFASAFVLYTLFHTVYNIPDYGLGPELTSDYHERSSLFAVMEGFAVSGTVAGTVVPFLFFVSFGGQRPGFTAFAITFGAILTLLYFWQCYKIKERPDYYTRKPNPLVPGMRRVLRNRPARILLLTYVVGSITGAIPGTMMPFFTKYVLGVDNFEFWLMVFLGVYFGTGLLMLPVWVRLARRYGKYPIYIVTALMGVLASLSLFFIGEGQVWLTLVVLIWAGAPFGARLFLGPAIQADVIDYDELYSGKRREAQYGSLWSIITKFVVIPSAALPLAIMAQLGYEPNVEQNETVRWTISAIFGLAPATFGLLSLLCFLFFPIRERNHVQILQGIQAHKRGEVATDPLTGKQIEPPVDRGLDEDTGWFLDHFSRRELARTLRVGAGSAIVNASVWAAVSLVASVVCFWMVSLSVTDLSEKPGLLTTFEVLGGGVFFTAFVYHTIRARAAAKLRASPPQSGSIEAHLALNERLAT